MPGQHSKKNRLRRAFFESDGYAVISDSKLSVIATLHGSETLVSPEKVRGIDNGYCTRTGDK